MPTKMTRAIPGMGRLSSQSPIDQTCPAVQAVHPSAYVKARKNCLTHAAGNGLMLGTNRDGQSIRTRFENVRFAKLRCVGFTKDLAGHG